MLRIRCKNNGIPSTSIMRKFVGDSSFNIKI